jgi:hypothetical protein
MNRLSGYVMTACVAAGIGVSTACIHNDESIYIRNVVAPPDDCKYRADPAGLYINTGVVNVALASEYTPTFLIGSQLIPRADKDNVRAESARVLIEGAVVRVTKADGTLINEFTSLSSGTDDPGTGTDATYVAAGLTILDPPTIAILKTFINDRSSSTTIVAHVKAIGHTLGHQSVESAEFAFPIQICTGCLIYFAPEAGPNCSILAKSSGAATPAAATVCQRGADQIMDCRDCAGFQACDPSVANPK